MKMWLDEDIDQIIDGIGTSIRKMQGKSVLLTGAGGFLGRYIVAVVRKINESHPNEPINLVANDNFITSVDGVHVDESRNIKWLVGDAGDCAEHGGRFDYIFHAAGIASPKYYKANPLETIRVTVDSTTQLLERAKRDSSRFLFFSSSEVYGDPTEGNVPTPESYKGNVASRGERACYDESKRMGETLCWIYENYFGVFASVVRPFNIYGPGMLPTDARVLPNFANQINLGEKLAIYNDGQQTRTFCYITDAIIGIFKILLDSATPDVFNVGNPNPEISMKDLAIKVLEIAAAGTGIEYISYPDSYPGDEPNRRCPDISKLANSVDYAPSVDLDTGLKRFLSWAKANY
jgi:UDP-glucuronate decarboxylase